MSSRAANAEAHQLGKLMTFSRDMRRFGLGTFGKPIIWVGKTYVELTALECQAMGSLCVNWAPFRSQGNSLAVYSKGSDFFENWKTVLLDVYKKCSRGELITYEDLKDESFIIEYQLDDDDKIRWKLTPREAGGGNTPLFDLGLYERIGESFVEKGRYRILAVSSRLLAPCELPPPPKPDLTLAIRLLGDLVTMTVNEIHATNDARSTHGLFYLLGTYWNGRLYHIDEGLYKGFFSGRFKTRVQVAPRGNDHVYYVDVPLRLLSAQDAPERSREPLKWSLTVRSGLNNVQSWELECTPPGYNAIKYVFHQPSTAATSQTQQSLDKHRIAAYKKLRSASVLDRF